MTTIEKSDAGALAKMEAGAFAGNDLTFDGTMSVAAFVEKKFIPNHVDFKSHTGRLHYHAILKHVITPETVDRFFAAHSHFSNARMKSLPEWPYLDNIRLCDLNPDHVRRLTSSAASNGYSSQTVLHIRNVIGAIITHARKERMFIGDSPVAAVELPPVTRARSYVVTLAQAKSLIASLQYPEREIAMITINTGMSISEICALKWNDLDLTGKKSRIHGNQVTAGSCVVKRYWARDRIVDLEGSHFRVVPFPGPLVRMLKELKASRRVTGSDTFIFMNRDGDAMCPAANTLLPRLKPIGEKLGMPWISWQVLKRAHDSLFADLRRRMADEIAMSMTSSTSSSARSR